MHFPVGEHWHCFQTKQWLHSGTASITWNYHFKNMNLESSGQDGGVGRNALPPSTTKRRVTTNLKTINNQKCQKIKLHGTNNQGVKETSIQTGRKGGDAQPGRADPWHSSRLCKWGGTGWTGNWRLKTSSYKILWGLRWQEKLQSHRRVRWKVGLQQSKQQHCSLSDPSPIDSTTKQQGGLPHLSEYLRLHLLTT